MNDKPKTSRPRREDYERAMRSMGSYMDIGLNDLMLLAERAEHFAAQRQTESLPVKRIMGQPVLFVHPETPMSEAAHLMVSERISGLPVVNDKDQLVGIITEADFLRALGVPAHQPTHNLWQTLESLFSHLAHHAELKSPDDPVSAYMVESVICISPDHCMHDALALMKQHRVKRLLVCDQPHNVVGVLTRSDLMRTFFDRFWLQARSE
ncbi:MAG: CBS domain-containing protein [Chromatiales bacterium]|jgi:CBS-domain-containing membrane protein